MVNQISVFLENKPGTLGSLTKAFADAGIDMRALSLAETKDFGIARIIVDDAYDASTALKDAGFVSSLTPVLVAAVPDKSGGLNSLLAHFEQANVNIEYMYAFLGAGQGEAYMVFRVSDTATAEKALTAHGVRLMSQEDIAEI